MKYLPSGKMVSKINRLSCRKKLLLVNKKKQENFVNQGVHCLAGVHSDLIHQKFYASFFQTRCFLRADTCGLLKMG